MVFGSNELRSMLFCGISAALMGTKCANRLRKSAMRPALALAVSWSI